MPCRGKVSGALIGNFVQLSPFFSNANSMKLSADSTTFSFHPFFFLFFNFRFVFLAGLYHIVIVSRVVITDCSSPVNFLLVCVITPCYVIIFVMFCHLLYCKFI